MTTIIADAGSTKTDWKIITDGQEVATFLTIGFNPVLTNTALIIKELTPFFSNMSLNGAVEAVYYYGAGCWDE